MNLYDLTIEAEKRTNEYRHPDLNEWKQSIDPVLKAAGENTISRDHVDGIILGDEKVHIETSYTVRGCEQTQRMELPLAILKADNPVQAATQYRLEKALKNARSYLSAAEKDVIRWRERIDALMIEIKNNQTEKVLYD